MQLPCTIAWLPIGRPKVIRYRLHGKLLKQEGFLIKRYQSWVIVAKAKEKKVWSFGKSVGKTLGKLRMPLYFVDDPVVFQLYNYFAYQTSCQLALLVLILNLVPTQKQDILLPNDSFVILKYLLIDVTTLHKTFSNSKYVQDLPNHICSTKYLYVIGHYSEIVRLHQFSKNKIVISIIHI